MDLIQGLHAIDSPGGGSVLSIGNFDGVHLGHRTIVRTAREKARHLGLPLIVLTFDPHPLSIVSPQRVPERLCTLEDKIQILESIGVDVLVIAHSDADLLSLTPEEFVRDIIGPRFAPVHIVEGRSFGFGKDRAGDVNTLSSLGRSYGFAVTIVEPVRIDAGDGTTLALSSSAIRDWLGDGLVERAAVGLDGAYALRGTVATGDSRGRGLGFPTANLEDIDQLIPGEGVYAGFAEVDGQRWPAAISIGDQPTFDRRTLTVEAYLLDYNGDLYGKGVRLIFLARLRDQRKFSSAEALADQIARDVEAVRQRTRDPISEGSP